MTKAEAYRYIAEHEDDDTLDEDDLVSAFRAIYGRYPDARTDYQDGLWSLLCSAHEDEDGEMQL